MSRNICLVIDSLGGGGAERSVLSLAQGLSNMKCRVDVIVLSDVISYNLHNIDFNVHFIKRSSHPVRLIRIVKRVKLLRQKITEIGVRFDLIVANLVSSSVTCKLAALSNVHYCIHSSLLTVFSGSYYKKNKWFFRIIHKLDQLLLIEWLYKNKSLIAVSQAVKDELILFGVKPKTIKVIYNPFDFESIRDQAEMFQVNNSDYIIHVGRFSPIKRHDILIKAYKMSGVNQKLLLLGDHDNETGQRIKQLVVYLGLQDKVIFEGFNSNPFPYIKNSKALILSSDYESLSMVLIESLILKIPVVSTNCIGPSEIFTNDLMQFLSPVGDVDKLAKNIKKVIKKPVKITDEYVNRFNGKVSCKQYLALCDHAEET